MGNTRVPKSPMTDSHDHSAPAAGIYSWSLPGADGQTIIGDTHIPDGESAGVLIVCHGFKGYKDYGFFPYLAQRAAGSGLIAHRFNFSHSGMTNDVDTFARPDLFELDTWGKQMHDLQAVAVAVCDGSLAGAGLPVTWFGHSRGGVTLTLTAGELCARGDPLAPDRIAPVAAPDTCCHLPDEFIALLREQGYLESPSSRTGQTLRIGLPWLDEIESDPKRFDPLRAIRHVTCPMLIVHGTNDATVSVESAQLLARAAGDHADLQIIDGASHTFNCPNPLEESAAPPAETVRMVEMVCAFARE